MFFSKIIALAAIALAPIVSADLALQFTSVPGPFTIGQESTVKWNGGDGDSVSLILVQSTVSGGFNTIGIIARNLNGTSYDWTPSSSLVPGDSYVLQLTQGIDVTTYSSEFSIQPAADGSATTILAVGGSSTSVIATLTPNSTSTITMHLGTGTAASGTGTGVPISRNTTMVSPTLSITSATVTTTQTSTSASTGGGVIAQATAQAMIGLGAVAAAAMYLL